MGKRLTAWFWSTSVWAWVIGALISVVLSAFIGAVTYGILNRPAPPPTSIVKFVSVSSKWQIIDDQLAWLVAVEANVKDRCTIRVTRYFEDDNGQPVFVDPLRSYGGDRPMRFPYLADTRVGAAKPWFAYAIEPGRFDRYFIELRLIQCDGGSYGYAGAQVVNVTMPPPELLEQLR